MLVRLFSVTIFRGLLTLSLVFFFAACSSTQDQQDEVTATIAESPKTTNKKNKKVTSESMLARAQDQVGRNQRASYIRAAQLAYMEQKPTDTLLDILNKIEVERVGTLRQEFALAELYILVEDMDSAEVVIDRLKKGALPREYTATLWLLINKISSYRQEHLSVLRQAFRAKSLYKNVLTEPQQQELNRQIWLHIQQVPMDTLSQFNQEFGDTAQLWTQLVNIINQHLSNIELFTQKVTDWQKQYAQQENINLLPAQILSLTKLTGSYPKHIALILPYTGKLAKQANAIRNGFLTGLELPQSTKISFIDSELLTLVEIEQQVQDSNIDFVVGPLLKERISEFSQSAILQNIPNLYLNQITHSNNVKQQYFFSLAPEDEIKQAVEYFSEQEIKYPAVIYADNSLGRRLSQQFLALWQLESETDADFTAFQSQSKLGDAVKELLDVSNSEKRIKEMESLFGRNLKSEERSRNDIDAVYIIANSQQTRLIKPFFDVNMSTFGKALPIYSSSRSYVVGETREQKKDLNGLIFTEMPWLIQDKARQVTQAYNAMELNNTQLKKLFAFGYDASKLLSVVEQLTVLPLTKVQGLTGQLQLNEQNQINRKLLWSQYRQGRIYALSKQGN